MKIQKNKSCLNIIALCGQFHYYKKLHGYEKINHNQPIFHLNCKLDSLISVYPIFPYKTKTNALNYFSSNLIILVKF